MITLRRANTRQHQKQRKHERWQTFFFEDQEKRLANGFGALESLDEIQLAPRATVPRRPGIDDALVITFVREGALTIEDSLGRSGVICAGEFHRMFTGRNLRYTETNASTTDCTHIFQSSLRPSESELVQAYDVKRFSTAERKNRLCAIAAPDARGGAIPIQQDALIYSALLDPGQHLVHEIAGGRSAWLHLVHGELLCGNLILTTGDGEGITGERAVSVTAIEYSEILLFDLPRLPRRPRTQGVLDKAKVGPAIPDLRTTAERYPQEPRRREREALLLQSLPPQLLTAANAPRTNAADARFARPEFE